METNKNEIFEKLSKINVNEKTEKKGKFTYLSWSFAWGELKKVSPTATAKVYHDKNTNMPYFTSKAGVIVKVGVTVDGLEHINYLPVMDFRNNSIPADSVNMMDINKAIQRCTVKAIALHGLGLYIYAGEDLPEEEIKTKKVEPVTAERLILITKEVSQLKDDGSLNTYYGKLSTNEKANKAVLKILSDKRTDLKQV